MSEPCARWRARRLIGHTTAKLIGDLPRSFGHFAHDMLTLAIRAG